MANPKRAHIRPRHQARPAFALLSSILISTALVACSGSGSSGALSATTSADNATHRVPLRASAARPQDPRHLVGDYDDDDYGLAHSDGDNDDSRKPPDKDNDNDSSGSSSYDDDDRSVRNFGRRASPVDRKHIIELVKSYYAVAAAERGASACLLIYLPLENTFARSLGEAGPRYLHGLKSCSAILSRMFKLNHRSLTTYTSSLEVTDVRTSGTLGLAVLHFATLPTRQVEVIRDHRSWMMYAPLDNELP
jgi:hypothetical protein